MMHGGKRNYPTMKLPFHRSSFLMPLQMMQHRQRRSENKNRSGQTWHYKIYKNLGEQRMHRDSSCYCQWVMCSDVELVLIKEAVKCNDARVHTNIYFKLFC